MTHRLLKCLLVVCAAAIWLLGCGASAKEAQSPSGFSAAHGRRVDPEQAEANAMDRPLTRADAVNAGPPQGEGLAQQAGAMPAATAAEPEPTGTSPGSDVASAAGVLPAPSGGPSEPAAGTAAAASTPQPAEPASASAASLPPPVKPGTLLDIEARLQIYVESLATAMVRVRQVVQRSGGTVTQERTTDNGLQPMAELTLRIPSQAANDALEALGGLGVVRDRRVTVEDVGKDYYDASMRLENFEMLRKRYERILERAEKVEDILRIERELNTVRERTETLKGELRWLRDRAASATVYLALVGPERSAEPIGHAEAKFYPGLRVHYLADFWRDTGDAGYLGAGASVRASRAFSIDIDGFSDTSFEGRGPDVLLLTLGGEYYSDFLGGGGRTWFNPYLGYRLGYARVLGKNEAAFGGTLGFELLKSRASVVDVETRVLGLLGSKQGAHLALQPGVGFNVAF